MRSLDEFYKYIEKQERALREREAAAPKPAAAVVADPPEPVATAEAPEEEVHYLMRGGVTIAVRASQIERASAAAAATAAPPATTARDTAHGDDYLPELVESGEPTQVAEVPSRLARPTRSAASAASATPPALNEGEAAALWGRLPRHIQLLVEMAAADTGEEIAQKYYTRGFKETRRQLIERLLDPTLTLEDTARVLGVCPTTVRRYTNRGVLPHHRTVGQQRRFRLSDVLAFLERQKNPQIVPIEVDARDDD